MSNYYSMWEMGKSIDTNRIVSMTPVSPESLKPAELTALPLAAGSLAVSAIAQFGMYLEARRANELREAAFEERRHDWLNGILDQWVDEHMNQPGVIEDVTNSLVEECGNLLEQLVENPKMDIPQLLLLRVSRANQFLEENFRFMGRVVNRIVEESKSPEEWLVDVDYDLDEHTLLSIEDASNTQNDESKKFMKGTLAGLPLAFIPLVGPFLGGAAVGGLYGAFVDMLKSKSQYERAKKYLPLIKISQTEMFLQIVRAKFYHILEKQDWELGTRLTVVGSEAHESELLFPRSQSGGNPLKFTAVDFLEEDAL